MRWLSRLILSALGFWLVGLGSFAIFVMLLPEAPRHADGIVVFTGPEPARLTKGFAALDAGAAPRLLISGVDRRRDLASLREEAGLPAKAVSCCAAIGYEALDTIGNAAEAAEWAHTARLRIVTLVTADYHMGRAVWHLRRRLPGTEIVPLALRTGWKPRLVNGFIEYNKLLVQAAEAAFGLDRL